MFSFTIVSAPALSVVGLCMAVAFAVCTSAVLVALAFQQRSDARDREAENRLKEQLHRLLAQTRT